jgi:trigger factor
MIVKNTEKKENSTVTFQVEADAEAFEAAVEKAYRRNKGSIFVAGFRKGKAPRTVIEGMYGAEVFYEDAAEILAPEAFDFGVAEAKIDNVGAPSFLKYDVDENKAVTLTFSTEVYPEVVLGDYLGLEAVMRSRRSRIRKSRKSWKSCASATPEWWTPSARPKRRYRRP